MTDLLSSFIFLLSVLALTSTEKRYLNNLFTPFTVTAWPLAVISVLVNTVAVKFDFLPVTARVNYFLLLNVFLIWLVGYLFYQAYRRPAQMPNYREVFSSYKNYRYFIIFLSWIVILGVAYKIFSIVSKEGWQFIGSDKFEKMMIVGIAAHLVQLGKVLLILIIFILWNSKKSWLDYLTIMLLIVCIMSLMVKYHIVWVLLIIFFVKNLRLTPKLQFRKIYYITLSVVAIFVINYLVLFLTWQTLSILDKKLWEFIFGWMFNYLMTGPILLDQWMDMAFTKPWWSLFIVPINFINVILGDPERLNAVTYVSPGFSRVSPMFSSNVGTSFGVYYLIGGFAFTILTTIIIAVLSYIVYFRSFKSSNPIIVFLNAFFLTLGTLSFFVQYFTLLSLYEITVIYIILERGFYLLNKINQKALKNG